MPNISNTPIRDLLYMIFLQIPEIKSGWMLRTTYTIARLIQHIRRHPTITGDWGLQTIIKIIARLIQYIHRPPTIKGGWGLQTTIKNSTVYSVYSPFPNHKSGWRLRPTVKQIE